MSASGSIREGILYRENTLSVIAYSPKFKVMGFGETKEEAAKDLEVALTTFTDFHLKHNNLIEKLQLLK